MRELSRRAQVTLGGGIAVLLGGILSWRCVVVVVTSALGVVAAIIVAAPLAA